MLRILIWVTTPCTAMARAELLFTENESNLQRLCGQANPSPWVKDAFHRYVVAGESGAVNPAKTGTKAAARYILDVPSGARQSSASGCLLPVRRSRSGTSTRRSPRASPTPTSSTSGSRPGR